jgi:selenocysteine lyase/cysteine desulfurase
LTFANQGFYEAHERTKIHQDNYEQFKSKDLEVEKTEKPVVFTSIMEHNSNLLPWRESGAIIEYVNIREDTGELNYDQLEKIVSKYEFYNGFKIGTFTAGSNITGTLTDVDYISYILHKNGALSFIDYAAVAPYVEINMNGPTKRFTRVEPSEQHMCYKDAIFISTHKFVGGPDTPGILVCKKIVICHNKPAQVGGGIVFYVDRESHMYIRGVEEREEGGTP